MTIEKDYYSIIIPDYLSESDRLVSSDEESISSVNEEVPGQREGEFEDTTSSSDELLSDIFTNTALLVDDTARLNHNIEVLTEGISVVNDNLLGVLVILVVFLIFGFIKVVFSIFNKYLGLGNC